MELLADLSSTSSMRRREERGKEKVGELTPPARMEVRPPNLSISPEERDQFALIESLRAEEREMEERRQKIKELLAGAEKRTQILSFPVPDVSEHLSTPEEMKKTIRKLENKILMVEQGRRDGEKTDLTGRNLEPDFFKEKSPDRRSTPSSVILCLENLIGMEMMFRRKSLIPRYAAKGLGVSENDCFVVEDSVIGLQAATGAGMSCVISYTPSTANQDFKEAAAIYPDLSNVRLADLEALFKNIVAAK